MLNFPTSPTVGQTYQRWVWNGVSWVTAPAVSQPMLPIVGGVITGNLGVQGTTSLTGTLTAAGMSNFNTVQVNGAADFLDGVTIDGDDAATKVYVDEAIAAGTTWQGTWDASANTPDLTAASLQNNGWTWSITTPDATAPFTIPATPIIPGLNGVTVYNGDHAVWSASASAFEIIHGSSLSLQEAQAMFLALSGGTLTAPGNLSTAGNLNVTGAGTLNVANNATVDNHLIVNGGTYLNGTQFNANVAGTCFFTSTNGSIYFQTTPMGGQSAYFNSNVTLQGGPWPGTTFTAPGVVNLGPTNTVTYPPWPQPLSGPVLGINQWNDVIWTCGSQFVVRGANPNFANGFFVNEDNYQWVGLLGTNFYMNAGNSSGLSSAYFSSSTAGNATMTVNGYWTALECHAYQTALAVTSSVGNAINVIAGLTVKPGGGAWSAPSDVRTKTDVHEYERGLADIAKLNPIRFRYNGRFRMPETGKTFVGLHAEEAREVMPEMVYAVKGKLDYDDDETDILHVDPSALSYATINAIKELAKRLEALEAKR